MPLTNDDIDRVANRVMSRFAEVLEVNGKRTTGRFRRLLEAAMFRAVWSTPGVGDIERVPPGPTFGRRLDVGLPRAIGRLASDVSELRSLVEAQGEQVAQLREALVKPEPPAPGPVSWTTG